MFGLRVMKWDIHEPAPTGLITEAPWPDPHQAAICPKRYRQVLHKPEDIPAETCSCGIYALRALWMADLYAKHTLDPFIYQEQQEIMFTALVQGYGKLVLHETGWRAASAEILGVCSLWREPPSREGVFRIVSAASFYQVPVLNSWEVIQLLAGTQAVYTEDPEQGGSVDA